MMVPPAAKADLHVHSACSDGTESPAELLAAVSGAGVDLVALTDHDTTEGWSAAGEAAIRHRVMLLPGAELTTRVRGRSLHLLAYLFDPADPTLTAMMSAVREDRYGRAERIVANIARDHDFAWADVLRVTAPGATIGRPHIADALVTKGIVPNRSAAFDGILHPRAGYYEPHRAPEARDTIAAVLAAGGVPVIAHPITDTRSGALGREDIEELIEAGAAGVEIAHREVTAAGARLLHEIAADRNLIVTGSSDYHGSGKPNRLGEHTTSPEMVQRIIERGRSDLVVGD